MRIPDGRYAPTLALVVLAAVLSTAASRDGALTWKIPARSAVVESASLFSENDAPSAGGISDKPLWVDKSSHIVVLEYEAWFGPNAVTFQNAEAMPWLQSQDMQQVGGGYDSTDPHVIAQHLRWMNYMGVDAVTIDLTNNVGCIFSIGPVSSKFCNPATEQFRQSNQNIRNNTGNLYPAWTELRTGVKLIPLLGCQSWMDLAREDGGATGFRKEIDYFGSLMQRYPDLNVIYEGRPLMLVYTGTPVNTNLLSSCQAVLRQSDLLAKYTFRFVAGYLDSQPMFWENPNQQPHGPIQIAPQYGFWSVVDRYKPSFNLYPTYSLMPDTFNRVENLTASIATAGQTGWGCPQPTYCPDDALRYGGSGSRYITLQSFMALAEGLKPTFLIVDQFNEFAKPDEGWNAETSDDSEPTQMPAGWGFSAVQAIHDAICAYRVRE